MNADEAFAQALGAFGRERMLYGAGLALVGVAAGALIWQGLQRLRAAQQQPQQEPPDAAHQNAFARWVDEYGRLNS